MSENNTAQVVKQTEQVEEIIVTSQEQIDALNDSNILSMFREPASASDVAKDLKLTANLVHYHVKRYLDLGLMFEVSREAGRIYYQLSSLRFKYQEEPVVMSSISASVAQLNKNFLSAYETSQNAYLQHKLDQHEAYNDSDWSIISFNIADSKRLPITDDYKPVEAYPTHFQQRTINISSKAYTDLVTEIFQLISKFEVESTEKSTSNKLCTFSFMAFKTESKLERPSDSQNISTFMEL